VKTTLIVGRVLASAFGPFMEDGVVPTPSLTGISTRIFPASSVAPERAVRRLLLVSKTGSWRDELEQRLFLILASLFCFFPSRDPQPSLDLLSPPLAF